MLAMALAGCKKNTAGLQDLDGQSVALSDYHGKTVLMNIWATWCGPCLKEIPDLKALQDEKSDSLVILGVLLDSGSPEAARPIVLDELKINYPVWYGDDAFGQKFQISVFPTTLILDKEGKIIGRFEGRQSKQKFLQILKNARG